MSREAKVGALVVAALAAFAVTIFLVGERNNLFVRKIEYFIRFENVGGFLPHRGLGLSGLPSGRGNHEHERSHPLGCGHRYV